MTQTKAYLEKTVRELQEANRKLRWDREESDKETTRLQGQVKDLELELEKMSSSQGTAEGRAQAWESAFQRIVRHYELVQGSPETVKAIAQEEQQLHERKYPDDMVPWRNR